MKAGCKYLLCVLVGVWAQSGLALEVLRPGYTVETYVTYSFSAIRSAPWDIAFDPAGRIYLSQTEYLPLRDKPDAIYRVNTDRTVTRWATNLKSPRRIAWGGGTAFGDYLYVPENYADRIQRIALNGTRTTFGGSIDMAPQALAIDRTGTYGGQMYMATRAHDAVWTISPAGVQTPFSPFPYSANGGPVDLAFDPGTNYGGQLYLTSSSDQSPYSGLFSLDPLGNATRFAPSILDAYSVDFDPLGLFRGRMFVSGLTSASALAQYAIWQVTSSGTSIPFARGTLGDKSLPTFAFGPDGDLYVPEWLPATKQVVISRIIPPPAVVPLPGAALLACLGLGCSLAKLRRQIGI